MKVLSNDIIALLNKKNDTAFDVAFTVYYPRLVAFAKEYVPEDDAMNFVQDAFITLLDKAPVFLNENQLQSYLYTNVKNNCLMFLRHEKVKKRYSDHKIATDTPSALNVEALERLNTSPIAFMEIEQIINDTLDQLPRRCREIFILSRMEGKKNLEVATFRKR
jgi:RNA polymerase sigma-70 factor (ECF subfamily)